MEYDKWARPEPPAAEPFESIETWWLRTLVARVEALRSELAESVRESRRALRENARRSESMRRPRRERPVAIHGAVPEWMEEWCRENGITVP